jgi:hypothetical protein
MPVLAPNQPMTLTAPELLVENRLAPGRHRFSLTVSNTRGVASEPVEVVVTVTRLQGPIVVPPVITTTVTPTLGDTPLLRRGPRKPR